MDHGNRRRHCPLCPYRSVLLSVLLRLLAREEMLTASLAGIPNAGLSAVIIHAVGDLIASPRQVYGTSRAGVTRLLADLSHPRRFLEGVADRGCNLHGCSDHHCVHFDRDWHLFQVRIYFMRAFEASWLEGPRRPKADPCLIIHSVGASAALLLYRIARPRGQFLGRVRIHEIGRASCRERVS